MNQGTDLSSDFWVQKVHGSAGARLALTPWRNNHTQYCSHPLEVTAPPLVSLIGSCPISRIAYPSGSGQPPR